MRKYRGLTKEGRMVYGDKVEIGTRCWIVSRPELTESDDMREIHCSIWGFIEVIPETVGQNTDFEDKNNVEIYEQDVLDSCWVVRFYDGHYVLCNPIDEPAKQCAKEMLDKLVAKESVITGNIHNVAC